jgi:hypothetical protein
MWHTIWITIINPDVSYWIKANYRHLIYTSLWCLTYAIHFIIAACFTTPQQGTCWTWIKCCDSAHLGDQMIRDCWPEKRAYCTRNTVCPPGNARFISIPCDAWTCQRAKYMFPKNTSKNTVQHVTLKFHNLDLIKHCSSPWYRNVSVLKTYILYISSPRHKDIGKMNNHQQKPTNNITR